ncbi:MAG: dihydroorotate dehydrogenase catalytic subunit [Bacillota bacterium]|nr:dihydroorotate dehydrogenase catalytic subunit [Bacillota bacterium]
MKPDLGVEICDLKLKNPVMPSSGSFGLPGYEEYMDLNGLGALVVKSITLHPRAGNPPPRIAETTAGMLNAVGIQNPGVKWFIKNDLQRLRRFTPPLIVSIAGTTVEEFAQATELLEKEEGIAAYEINVSCPNIEAGGRAFGMSAAATQAVVAAVKERTRRPIFTKLTPNVTDIVEIAQAAVEAGSDGLTLINTLLGMAIDVKLRRPVLANVFGGLSGPAIKPVALRCVYQVAQAVKVPIIGTGGISSATDVLEFLLAGASAVQVGTANIVDPYIMPKIIADLEKYLEENNAASVREYIGALKTH